jgi:class 3 adenylate cyclase
MVQERPIRVERRLSAILAADVAGYSRLMHDDEEATHAKLTDAVAPAIAEHGGCIVKNTGDGFLAEFPSAVEHTLILSILTASGSQFLTAAGPSHSAPSPKLPFKE